MMDMDTSVRAEGDRIRALLDGASLTEKQQAALAARVARQQVEAHATPNTISAENISVLLSGDGRKQLHVLLAEHTDDVRHAVHDHVARLQKNIWGMT